LKRSTLKPRKIALAEINGILKEKGLKELTEPQLKWQLKQRQSVKNS
jgi:hypothetical protein